MGMPLKPCPLKIIVIKGQKSKTPDIRLKAANYFYCCGSATGYIILSFIAVKIFESFVDE